MQPILIVNSIVFSTDTIKSRVIDTFGVWSKDVFDWFYSEGGYEAVFFVFLLKSETSSTKSVFLFDDEINNFHRDDIKRKFSDECQIIFAESKDESHGSC